MPGELSFLTAVLIGLLGSSHCIGMCGGIVGALNGGISQFGKPSAGSLFPYHIAYNLGRISSYVLVGLLAGFIGSTLIEVGVSPVMGGLIAASFMIALGLYLTDWWRGLVWLERAGGHLWKYLQPIGQKFLPVTSLPKALMLGLIWGWLPCGMVYAAVAWSLTSGSAMQGAWLMFGFGLGTLPALLLAGASLQHLGNWTRNKTARRVAGSIVILFGLYSGWMTLNNPHHAHDHQANAAWLTTTPSV